MSQIDDFPFVDSAATRMLAEGLKRVIARTGLSLRQLGKELGYKQAVVLSHMASGRVPIPIDRTTILATRLELDEQGFLLAVLEQRYPSVEWQRFWTLPLAMKGQAASTGLLAGVQLDQLSEDQAAVARELVRDTHPKERWLAIPEIAAVNSIRTWEPRFSTEGLSRGQLDAVKACIENNMRID